MFDNEDFGYHKIAVERPLRLNFQASAERLARLDADRRDPETVPLKESLEACFKRDLETDIERLEDGILKMLREVTA